MRFFTSALLVLGLWSMSERGGLAQMPELPYFQTGANNYETGQYASGPVTRYHVDRYRREALGEGPVWLDLDDYQVQARPEPVTRSTRRREARYPSSQTPSAARRPNLNFEAILRDYAEIVAQEQAVRSLPSRRLSQVPDRIKRSGEIVWIF